MKKKKLPYLWAAAYSFVLICFTVYVLLDVFVIPRKQSVVQQRSSYSSGSSTADSSNTSSSSAAATGSNVGAVTTANTYKDNNISITITTKTIDSTQVYVADITLSSSDYLKTALAENAYGRNLKETTSSMASSHNAIFAINGDYYGFRDYGFVIRNGVLYRDTAQDGDAMAVAKDGTLYSVSENFTNASDLINSGVTQALSFGPTLIENSAIQVDENTEVGQAKSSNPRTAIGMVSALHYMVIVSDGRTSESEGLSLYQLAQVFSDLGCTYAYNLDGGGSSTMWFNGSVINNPTDGRSGGEREVSDIVYIGYQ